MKAGWDLLVIADYSDGGLGMAAAAHAEHYAQRGWRTALAAPNAAMVDLPASVCISLPVPKAGSQVREMLGAARLLRGLVRSHAPRIVHAHGLRALVICRLAGVKPYVTFHAIGAVPGQSGLHFAARRLLHRAAPRLAIRAVSVAPTPGRWTVAPSASPRLRTLSELDSRRMSPEPTAVWVGRLTAQKRPDMFVRAVARAAERAALRGVMIGDGELFDTTARLVAEIDAPVDLVGADADVEPHLARAWAWCLFSNYEGVPFALQEAMWAGRACVVTPLPQVKWFAGDAVIYAADVDAAADALVQLCDRATAVEWGRRAARRAREVIDPDAPFPLLDELYDGAGGRSTARSDDQRG